MSKEKEGATPPHREQTGGAAKLSERKNVPVVIPNQGMTISEVMRIIQGPSRPKLLTRFGGEIEISDDDRRLVAVYEGGLVLVSQPNRWTGRVKSLLTLARNAGHEVKELFEVETSLLVDLYSHESDETGGAQNAASDGVRRQRELADLLGRAGALKASDIHIRVLRHTAEARVRVHGRMMDFHFFNPEDGAALIKAAMAVASDQGSASSDMAFQQGALTPSSGLLPKGVELVRLQYSPTSENRSALVMRLKYRSNAAETEIDALGYSDDQIQDITVMRRRTNGLYLLSGKVSSGKSTTLQRTLNKMLTEKDREISMYIIEEPKELEIPGAIQVIAKPQPDGVDGFTAGLHAALRSDPNVIVLGEIRSNRIADLAMEVIGSGHAVWSTIHAGSALGILDRLIDLGVKREDLTRPDLKGGLIYQRLCGVMCLGCRVSLREALKTRQISHDLAKGMLRLFERDPDTLFLRGPGCSQCHGGLSGRTVVAETVEINAKILSLFRESKRDEMRSYWLTPTDEKGMGGAPVLHHALVKVGAGICDINEVEEEVDMLSVYQTAYPHLVPRLRQEILEMSKQNEQD